MSQYQWICPQCSRSHTDEEVHLYGGTCRTHRRRQLVKSHFEYSTVVPPELDCALHPERQAQEESKVASTDEGDYDFGFDRPAPKVKPSAQPSTAPSDAEWEQLYGMRLQNSVPEVMDEEGAMGRLVKVLIDRLGGRVALNWHEIAYVVMTDLRPMPVIEKDEATGRVYVHTESGEF